VPKVTRSFFVVATVSTTWHTFENLFALRADRELAWISTWHPNFSTERNYWRSKDRTFNDFVFSHIMREPLVISCFGLLFDAFVYKHSTFSAKIFVSHVATLTN
jgi:hypothetical protein